MINTWFSNVSNSNSTLWIWLKCPLLTVLAWERTVMWIWTRRCCHLREQSAMTDIWQDTRLTCCQVSITLSLMRMTAPYKTSTKTVEGDSFALRYHKLCICEMSHRSRNKQSSVSLHLHTRYISCIHKRSHLLRVNVVARLSVRPSKSSARSAVTTKMCF